MRARMGQYQVWLVDHARAEGDQIKIEQTRFVGHVARSWPEFRLQNLQLTEQ
jgi:hypothetical protein